MESCPTLSLVVPAYNEHGNLEKLYSELVGVLSRLDLSWEIIFVDDGSKDSTWSVVQRLHQEDSRVLGIRLSRNFGHQHALIAGLTYARGSAVISMDADMQHPPEVISSLVDEWRKGNKIVKTVRRDPANLPTFKRLTSRFFYRLFSYLSGIEMQGGMADFRLLDREVLNQLLQFKEAGLFLRGIVEWVGYPSSIVSFDCGRRFNGVTKYTVRRMIQFAWHGVSSFSLVPLRIGIMMGLVSSTIAFLGVLYAILVKLLGGYAVPGWASTLAIISFEFGVLFMFLAILAEYVGRILDEVRERPRFIVSERLMPNELAADSPLATVPAIKAHASE
ncbi:MAG: glycosyltransferase family 2 protein [Nitrospirae bacterium]|nr:glycosyltransferase family 2 protein [Nitrospirota bacterium]MDE3041927.1 glycosyltransferase family 2 protein [Nitrospirota bacterium]